MKKLLVFCYMLVAAIGGCGGDASNSRELTKQEALAALSAADLGKIDMPFLGRLLDQGSGEVIISFAEFSSDPAISPVDRYAATKSKVAALFNTEQYQILTDYSLLPSAFVRINGRRAIIKLIQNTNVVGVGENLKFTIPVIETILPAIATNLLEHGAKFVSLRARLYYGETPDNIVIKDIDSWKRFLSAGQIQPEYGGNAFSVDFSKQMVLGVFLRTSSNCSVAQVLNWNSDGKKLQVEYVTQERASLQSCDTQNSAASTPMNLVVINKTDLTIEFINVNANQVEFSSLFATKYFSYYGESSDAIVRDNTSWSALRSSPLWDAILSLPFYSDIQTRNVDFSKSMLIGRLLGDRSNGCSLGEVHVWHSNGKLYVAHQERFPTENVACQSFVSLAYLIELPRTDEPIEFLTIPTSL
jgi:hypothetical protein